MKQIWWSVTFPMCISFFAAKKKEIKADIKQCKTDGLVLAGVSSQAWRNSIPLTLPFNMLVESHFGSLVIPLPMLVFFPVESPCTLWTSLLGFLVLEKRLPRSNIKEWNFLAHNLLCLEAAEKYVEPSSCLGSGASWKNTKLDSWDEKVHIAGPALAQLFQQRNSFTKLLYARERKLFQSIFFYTYIFFKGT